MALDSFTNLQAAVGDLLNRGDLTAVIPDWIHLTESELGRILEGKPMRTTVAVTYDTTGQLALPADYVRGEALTVETDSFVVSIAMKPYNYVIEKRGQLVIGCPRYAATVNDVLYLAPIPDSDTAYTGVLVYDAMLTPLSASNTTNWVLTNHPDVYLYGCAYHSAPYLRDEERLPLWEKLYRTALDQIRVARDKAEYGENTPVMRPRSALGV